MQTGPGRAASLEKTGRLHDVARIALLWLALGLIGGYAAAGSAVAAHNPFALSPPPFVNVGDELRLVRLEQSQYDQCTVAEIQGGWVRCAPPDRFASRPVQEWFNLEYVVKVEKREK